VTSFWPRSRPQRFGLGLGLSLKHFASASASFNITGSGAFITGQCVYVLWALMTWQWMCRVVPGMTVADPPTISGTTPISLSWMNRELSIMITGASSLSWRQRVTSPPAHCGWDLNTRDNQAFTIRNGNAIKKGMATITNMIWVATVHFVMVDGFLSFWPWNFTFSLTCIREHCLLAQLCRQSFSIRPMLHCYQCTIIWAAS